MRSKCIECNQWKDDSKCVFTKEGVICNKCYEYLNRMFNQQFQEDSYKELKEKLRAVQQENRVLNFKLLDCEDTDNQFDNQFERLKKRNTKLYEEKEDTKEQKKLLEAKLSESKTAIENLNKTLHKERNKNARLYEEKELLEEAIDELENESEEEAEQWEDQLQSYEITIDELEEENEKLKSNLTNQEVEKLKKKNEVIVPADHSIIVSRNSVLTVVKPYEIKKDDHIIMIKELGGDYENN